MIGMNLICRCDACPAERVVRASVTASTAGLGGGWSCDLFKVDTISLEKALNSAGWRYVRAVTDKDLRFQGEVVFCPTCKDTPRK